MKCKLHHGKIDCPSGHTQSLLAHTIFSGGIEGGHYLHATAKFMELSMMRDKLPRKPLLLTSSRGASRLKNTSSECTAWRMLRTCSAQLLRRQGSGNVLWNAPHHACDLPLLHMWPVKSCDVSEVASCIIYGFVPPD